MIPSQPSGLRGGRLPERLAERGRKRKLSRGSHRAWLGVPGSLRGPDGQNKCQRPQHPEFQGEVPRILTAFRQLPRASRSIPSVPSVPSSSGILPPPLPLSLPPPCLPSLAPSLSLPTPSFSFLSFLLFIYSKNGVATFSPASISAGDLVVLPGWGLCPHFAVDTALWIPRVFHLFHQTQGSPGQGSSSPLRLGLPEQALCVLLRGHPQGRVAGRPVPPCSIGVLGQVCLG